jgi:hypothetical protein
LVKQRGPWLNRGRQKLRLLLVEQGDDGQPEGCHQVQTGDGQHWGRDGSQYIQALEQVPDEPHEDHGDDDCRNPKVLDVFVEDELQRRKYCREKALVLHCSVSSGDLVAVVKLLHT